MELSNVDKNKKMVVYCIENKIDHKKYIGITKNSLKFRINGHKSKCRIGNKTAIYDAIRTFGEHNFSIYVLKECISEQDLVNSEIDFINKLRTSTEEYGYNILTDKYIFSKSRIGKKNNQNHKKILSNRMHSLKDKYIKLHEKEWVIINPQGSIFYIKNLQKFCRENNLDAPNMIKQTTYRPQSLYKGWQCFKKENFSKDKIKQFFNGVKIYFNNNQIEIFKGSIAEYAKKNNYDNSCLQKLRKGVVNKYKNIIKIENIKL
jgi:predicted transcriptional regulator